MKVGFGSENSSVEQYAKSVSPERLRWEVFFNAVLQHPIRQIYVYANDNHIDTLLRKIFSGMSG